MIARLAGKISSKKPGQIILDVGGVGYLITIPLYTFYKLGDDGSSTTLEIHTHVREDALALYGFCTPLEKELFEHLISVSGIGPKIGITILSGMEAEELIQAIEEANADMLTSIPGLGTKTASRVILELKDKVHRLRAAVPASQRARAFPQQAVVEDALSALLNLGYKKNDAERAIRKAVDSLGAGATLEEIIKRTLSELLY